jgi:uncharacterized protein YjbI with pentapeptide repeats
MLFENEVFDSINAPPAPATWSEHVFRGCTFEGGDLEGIIFGGVMDECTLTGVDLYWAFFNVALVARTRFEDCQFRGASFRGATLVDCTFVRCKFELDNLGSDCTIDDCVIAACAFERCSWIAKARSAKTAPKKSKSKTAKPAMDKDSKRDITNSKWLGCTQKGCKGFDGMF